MAYRNPARDRSRSPIKRNVWANQHINDNNSSGAEKPFIKDVDFDKHSYKTQIPCSIIMMKGLAQHLVEQDIRNSTLSAGVASKDVRLIRKNKGPSSGLAFVEFYSVEDSQRLMETQDGELMINGQFRAIMQYFVGSEWYCKCGAHNFKHREFCGKCGNNDVCPHPTNIIILTGLTFDMTEAKILEIVNKTCDLAIKCMRRARDGNCYIEMNCTSDAIQLHSTLSAVNLKVGYYRHKNIPSVSASAASSAVAAAKWNNTLADVPRLAEYSANLYAKTPEEKQKYLTYYTQYYAKQIADGNSVDISQETPDGLGTRIHPAPDISSFQYDQTSGYYYDSGTKLYYDANTQYFYNSKTNKYLYWDSTRKTYFNVPSSDKQSDTPKSEKTEESPDKKPEDKVKVAKKIAKDMEKWAKTLNQRKEISKISQDSNDLNNSPGRSQDLTKLNNIIGSADVCFSVLEKKDEKSKNSLVAAYESEDETEETVSGEEKLQIDWEKLACLICKRQFNSKEILTKHTQLSELHKTNLKSWYTSRNLDPNDAIHRAVQYRDRAKERRLKYGDPEIPPESKFKLKYSKVKEAVVAYEEPTKKGIGEDNVGNKLLQKMGWSQGQGLGKSNQGRTSIIEAEGRIRSAGLGANAIGMQPAPGETYKDCVKKMMRARYEQME